MSSLSLKLDEMNANINNRIMNMEDKLDLIMKRQSDIEEKIVFRVEKNMNPINNSMSDVDSKENADSRVILLKEKTESKVAPKRTKKKINESSSSSNEFNKRGNIKMRMYKDIVLLTGQTFDRKELIKQYGGKWDNKNMGWVVPLNKNSELKIELERYAESLDYDELNEYLNGVPVSVNKTSTSVTSFSTCQIVDSDDD